MRKTLFVIAALAAMTSCSQEMSNIEPQQPQGQTVIINCGVAEEHDTPDMKAAIGAGGKNVYWRSYDKISALVKTVTTGQDGTTINTSWTKNTLFTKQIPDDVNDFKFKGTFDVNTPLPKKGMQTWYLLHPYNADIDKIENDNATPARLIYKTVNGEYLLKIANPTQDYSKTNKMGHLNLPMYGIGESEAGQIPNIRLRHFCGVFEITVVNKLTEEIHVTNVSIENPLDKISGTFRVKVDDPDQANNKPGSMTLLGTNASNTSDLKVLNCTIAAGESAQFYLLARYFSLEANETLTITVKTDKNYVTSVKTMKTKKSFRVGEIHRTSVAYENPTANAPEPNVTEKMDINFIEWAGIEKLPIGMSAKGPSTPQYQFTDKGLILVGTSNGVNKLFIERKNPAEYLTVVKANGNGATTVYGSTDNKAWTKLISVKHDKNNTEPVTLTADVNKLCKGAKYFRFDGAKTDQTIQSISFTKPADSTPAE